MKIQNLGGEPQNNFGFLRVKKGMRFENPSLGKKGRISKPRRQGERFIFHSQKVGC